MRLPAVDSTQFGELPFMPLHQLLLMSSADTEDLPTLVHEMTKAADGCYAVVLEIKAAVTGWQGSDHFNQIKKHIY